MAKPTLLELVQDILSDADSDEVNSVTATVEADQAARVIRDSFRNLVDIHDIQHHQQLKQLTATGASTPTTMTRPEGFHSIEWIQYDKKLTAGGDARYGYVNWMEPDRFIEMTSSRTASDSTVTAVALASGYNLLVVNDQAPTYYTTLDGYENLIFDSYDSALETNLQQSKSLAFGIVKPTLALTDTATIDLPENLITLLRNDARATFFELYKGGVPQLMDRKRRQSETRAQRKKHITENQRPTNTGPYYGRK